MESLNKNKSQSNLNDAINKLFELEIAKGKLNITTKELKKINIEIDKIYKEFPELNENN